MGCVYSHSRRSRSSPTITSHSDNPRVFHVCNVDDHGQEVNFGKIEITDHELALHQKGRNSILWSLRSLRRYGFDSELFSFECGRRCPTGPGIYAFKCSNAEQLFNALQEAIQLNASQPPPTVSPDSNGTVPDVAPRLPPSRNTNPTNPTHEYINSPFYVNAGPQTPRDTQLPTARSDVNTNYAKLDDLVRFYVNIRTPAASQDSQTSPPRSPPAADPVNYILLDLDSGPPSGQPTIVTTAPPTPVSKTPTMELPVVTPPTTPTCITVPMSYAQIDFAKTEALSASAANRRKL
ncbi:fibroblast growth factor receptor substrate 2-like [Oppia nitens]|uniref:fibroblast growth factor receptor substrate 2-like n=1 Tax=Oppia nitens TaxID=1686743 RepID=UPI0023DC5207|nr:fibroblast growth factor receptor substrate 2-like [Oppia nitens]